MAELYGHVLFMMAQDLDKHVDRIMLRRCACTVGLHACDACSRMCEISRVFYYWLPRRRRRLFYKRRRRKKFSARRCQQNADLRIIFPCIVTHRAGWATGLIQSMAVADHEFVHTRSETCLKRFNSLKLLCIWAI